MQKKNGLNFCESSLGDWEKSSNLGEYSDDCCAEDDFVEDDCDDDKEHNIEDQDHPDENLSHDIAEIALKQCKKVVDENEEMRREEGKAQKSLQKVLQQMRQQNHFRR